MFGGYEYVEVSLGVMCKFFSYKDTWVEDT